jgi:hypothetical protein
MFSSNSPKNVILSGAPPEIYRVTQRFGAESKDPDGSYLTHAARSFSTTEAREQDLLRYVRRSAQDDDFVGVWTKNIQNQLALIRWPAKHRLQECEM